MPLLALRLAPPAPPSAAPGVAGITAGGGCSRGGAGGSLVAWLAVAVALGEELELPTLNLVPPVLSLPALSNVNDPTHSMATHAIYIG